jgi:hypothetical protein
MQVAYYEKIFTCPGETVQCLTTIEYLASCTVTGSTEATCLRTTRTATTWRRNVKNHHGTVYPLEYSNTTYTGSSFAVATATVDLDEATTTTTTESESCPGRELSPPRTTGMSKGEIIGLSVGCGLVVIAMVTYICLDQRKRRARYRRF